MLWLALGARRWPGRRLSAGVRSRPCGLPPIGRSDGRLHLSPCCWGLVGERSIRRLLGGRLLHGRCREQFSGKRRGFGYVLRLWLWLWLEGRHRLGRRLIARFCSRCCRRLPIGRSDGRLDDGL